MDQIKEKAEQLFQTIKRNRPGSDIDIVRLAFEFAEKAHDGQMRMSGEPYIIHPLAAAQILADINVHPVIIASALLHDVPEDTNATLNDIEKNFGGEIASMVGGITKLGKIKYRGVERYIENLRKMFISIAQDVRVILIKFADRIHNLETLEYLPPKKRYRIALESLEIFAPIANRLGMGEIKGTIEDLSFKYVYPKEFEWIKQIRDQRTRVKEEYFKKVISTVQKELETAGIKVHATHWRLKHLYSLYLKMMRYDKDIKQIYDLVALRIIVDTVADCYATLGIIHKIWKPLRGRIKDYIAQPKPNRYQSIHTTVFCVDGEITEFQIRTKEMHEEAEYGIAAHWHYDETGSIMPDKKVEWVKQLADIQKNIMKKVQDLELLKVDFFKNRIFVFTPKGDVIDLPEEATPVDFAYAIHTDIGNKCMGAKINNQIVQLDVPLKSGDVVDIMVDKNRKGPNPDWITFVKTVHARNNIKHYMKQKTSAFTRLLEKMR